MKTKSNHTLFYRSLLVLGLLAITLWIAFLFVQQPPPVQARPEFDCAAVSEIPQAECEALVALYDATGGEQWTTNTDWLTTNTPCSWLGVACSDSHVTNLSLSNMNLTGAIPAEIGNLGALKWLFLGYNKLTSLPPEIGSINTLEIVIMTSNQLAALTPGIGNLGNLNMLDLENNQLTSLPPEIGGLNKLQYLYLADNLLASLPAGFENLSNLQQLDLSNNQLASLPDIGSFSTLFTLNLHDNPLRGELPSFLTGITMLDTFTFYNTNWCAPATGAVTTWLDNLMFVQGTGLICGQEAGGISGLVSLPDLTPAPGIQVFLYRLLGNPWHPWVKEWEPISNTLTSAAGSYQFNDLGEGIEYGVHFVDPTNQYAPQYYDNQAVISMATPVSTTMGKMLTGINATLRLPQPPMVTVDPGMGSVSFNPDGTANIQMYRGHLNDIAITLTVTCSSGPAPTDVNLVLTPPGQSFPMSSLGNDAYQGTIPAASITGNATLSVAFTCNGAPGETQIGYLTLYDPSGIITDASSGKPVVGATVTLYHVPGWLPRTGPTDTRPDTCESNNSKAAGVPWSQPAPTDLGIIANAEVKPIAPISAIQQTNEIGYYGWDVSEGCWYVEVEAQGYASLVSPVVGVPPEVTDLHLTLAPVKSIYLPLTTR